MTHPVPSSDDLATKTTMTIDKEAHFYDVAASWKHLNTDLIAYLETLELSADWTMVLLCYLQLSAKALQSTPSARITAPIARQVISSSLQTEFMFLNTQLLTYLKTRDSTEDWTSAAWQYPEHSGKIWQNFEAQVGTNPRRASPPGLPISTPIHPLDAASRTVGVDQQNFELHDEMEGIHAEAASTPRTRPHSFLQLPPELREKIYSYVATPAMAEAHVKENKIPSLLHVNRGVREDFARFYYGRRVFKAEFYNRATSTWEELRSSATMQAMFECWVGCWVDEDPCQLARQKRFIEVFYENSYDSAIHGVLRWLGSQTNEAVSCWFSNDATRDVVGTRSEMLFKARARRQALKRLEAEFS